MSEVPETIIPTHEVIMCPVCLHQDVYPLHAPRTSAMYHRCPKNVARWNHPGGRPIAFRWTGETVSVP